MDASSYHRTIKMHCPTCGGTGFIDAEDESKKLITCASCSRTLTRDELLRENSENLSENLEEMKEQAVKEVSNTLKASLRKAFKSSKNIRIK